MEIICFTFVTLDPNHLMNFRLRGSWHIS